ncbi:hypothetical protein OG272_13965 [Streptomyces sp. NBC_00104]|uniref:hypothetical protein n=1 Tax=unclassified Streptomyces TaxID=2593676 RepID=UPI0032460924
MTALAACMTGIGGVAHAEPVAQPTANSQAATGDKWEDRANRAVNVRSAGKKCGKKVIAEASGRGRMTLRIDETKSIATTRSKDISLTVQGISGAVGWDVTKSRSITVSGSREVSRGKYGVLAAYTRYSGKKFDVKSPDLRKFGGPPSKIIQRNKVAWKPIGVCFKYKEK